MQRELVGLVDTWRDNAAYLREMADRKSATLTDKSRLIGKASTYETCARDLEQALLAAGDDAA